MPLKIRCDQVELGMYILGFGGSWLNHPFWRARFLLETQDDLSRLRESGVPYVLIDEQRGNRPQDSRGTSLPSTPTPAIKPHIASHLKPLRRLSAQERALDQQRRAARLVSRSRLVVCGLFDDARAGKAVRIEKVGPIVDAIAASVAYSPQTLLGLTRLKNKDEYTYLHSMAVCTLMVSVAQYLGMDDARVRKLGLAGLLHDIGKSAIPDEILNKQGSLTKDEFQNVRAHPVHGYELLCATPEIPEEALDVCRHHHEKADGSGYPFGLHEAEISFAARLGAICDVYDALTSDRAYKEAWSPEKAISEMWSWEGHFDREILFTFMQAVAVHPPGMLVRLHSGRLAVMLEKSPVAIILNPWLSMQLKRAD